MRARQVPALRVSFVFFLSALALMVSAQDAPLAPPNVAFFSRITSSSQLPDGIELRSGPMLMKITALNDNLLRIRASRDLNLPEDASWAVLPDVRSATVPVTQDSDSAQVGFRTQTLRVAVNCTTGLLTVRDKNGAIIEQDASPIAWNGAAFRLTKAMPADEHYFGLGDKTGGLDRRNHAFTLWNTDAYRFQESTDPIYKSIPFFLAYRAGVAVGTLLDNTWRSSFDFGKESPDAYSFGAVDGPLDYYIFLGPTPRDVVETYASLTGKPPLPPLWALGYQQSRYTYTPESRLMEVAARLRTDRIPADALYLDIDFQDRNRPFTINPQTFPDLPSDLIKLHAMHFHVVAITDLHIANAPGQHYPPFDSGIAANAFLHNPDGSLYVGSVWPGPSVFPDFTRITTRSWWGTLYKPFTQLGFDGFWNDMNEPSVFSGPEGTMPLTTVHRIEEQGFKSRNATHAEIHNVFGMQNSRATYDGLRALKPDARPFVLTRASYTGGQRYAVTWTGDNSSTWNHLRMATSMLKNLGLSGFAYSGADVGGFAGTATPDLLTKWFEVAAFQPFDRDHTEKGTGDQEPWVGGPAHENMRRRSIETRYRLLPYIYTIAQEAAQTGLPMERPLFLDYPDATPDKHAIDLDSGVESEFLLGHDLLIAPSPYPEAPDSYTVEFPSARWFDYWTGERVIRPTTTSDPDPNAPRDPAEQLALSIKVTPSLDQLPVFVRAGAIVPLEPLVQSTEEPPSGPLTLRVYTGDDCHGSLYADDGKSFAYQHGDSLHMNFTCAVNAYGLTLQISPHEGSFVPWWRQFRIEVYGFTPASGTIVQDGRVSAATIEHGSNFFSFTIEDSGKGVSIRVK